MDNPGEPMIVYLYGNDRYITDLDVVGVHYVQLMIDEYSRRYLNGFLIIPENGDDSSYGFFSFNDLSSHVIEIQLYPILQDNRVNIGYKDLYENLTAEEFRRTVADLLGGGGSNPVNVPGEQATATVVVGPLQNLNGRYLSAYDSELINTGGYVYYHITKANKEELTEEQAADYMEYMTGSRFIPQFNYEKPQNSLWVTASGEFLKPQWSSSGTYAGMYLFVLPNPFALKTECGTNLYRHTIDFAGEFIEIINDNSDPILSDEIKSAFSSCISAKSVDWNSTILYVDDGAGISVSCVIVKSTQGGYQLDTISFSLEDYGGDEVTPL